MNPSFAILRTAKLKTLGNVAGSLSHTYRTRETTNADPSLAADNEHSHGTPGEVVQALKDRLPEKRRKDAVIGLEFFIGGSPEWFEGATREQQTDYFRDAVAWLEKRHGKENVVGWSIHRDEKTPHLVAYVVPLDAKTGKLNAKQWTGGAAALSRMQTDFARDVAASHGLERGIEGSKAHHQTIKQHYAAIQAPAQEVTISPEAVQPRAYKPESIAERLGISKRFEPPEAVAERLTTAVRQAYAPAMEAAKLTASERRRAAEMSRTALTLETQKKALQRELEGLRKALAPVLELATLAKTEFARLVQHAQERVQAITAERAKAAAWAKLDQERQRRVDDLVRVERKTAGAACTLAQHALAAIRQAGGQATLVDWPKVERAAIIESIRENQQPPKDVLAAIVRYSPGMVEPSRHETARALVSQIAGRELAPAKAKAKGMGYDSGPR